MPWYRLNGIPVHVKLSGKGAKNSPVPCVARVQRGSPGVAARCCGISSILCDYELPEGGSCDAPLCSEHALEVGKDRHLCPIHAAQHRAAEPELF